MIFKNLRRAVKEYKMATKSLKFNRHYGNTYEGMLETFRHQKEYENFFNEQDWINAARGNSGLDLDAYSTALINAPDKITDYQEYYNKYGLEFADSKTRTAALYNEVLADRTNVDTVRERYVKDADGNVITDDAGKPLTEKFKASDYVYYGSIIKEQNDLYRKQWEYEQELERKESMNFWERTGYNILGTGTSVIGGLANMLDGVLSFVGGVSAGVNAYVSSKVEDNKVNYNADSDKAFYDAFAEKTSSDDWRIFQGVEDWAMDFERRYTTLRDYDGNYTNLGKFFGQVPYTLAQMLPSMLLGKGLGKGLGKAGVSASTAAKIASASSQLVFYTGMTGNNIREMYNQFAAEGVSVSSASIIYNAAIKSTIEYAVEIGLAKMLGGTSLDNLVFGRSVGKSTGKTLLGSTFKRIFFDANQEGLEEVLQDTSSFLVDKAFSLIIDENFGEITDLTWESLMDAFVIGSLTSLSGSAMNIVKVGMKPDKQSGLKGFKGRLMAYEYGLNMQSFVENFDTVKQFAKQNNVDLNISESDVKETTDTTGDKISNKNAQAAIATMYASYRLLASVYNEIGEARVKAADVILSQITNDYKSGKFDVKLAAKLSEDMYNSLFDKDKSMLKQVIDAKMTQLEKVYSEEDLDDDEELDEDTKKVIEEVINSSKDIKKVAITKDGKEPKKVEDTVLIPKRLASNSDSSVVLHSLAEQNLVNSIIGAKYVKIKLSLDKVVNAYKQLSGVTDASVEEAVYSLVLDPEARLYKALLVTANTDMVNFLAGLIDVVATQDIPNVEEPNPQDVIFKDTVTKVVNRMRATLTAYAKVQPMINESVYDRVLTNAQSNSVRKERWSKNIYTRVIEGKSLTETDKRVLYNRVNNAPLSAETKKVILDNLTSNKAELRESAMNRLDAAYYNIFTSEYDGVTYMPLLTIPNVVFNDYLQNIGKTLSTLLNEELSESDKQIIMTTLGSITPDTIRTYRITSFMKATNNRYTFTVENGKYSVIEVNTNKRVGYSNYRAYEWQDYIHKDIVTLSSVSEAKQLLDLVLAKDIDAVTRSMIDITDVINSDGFLKKEHLDAIVEQYGYVSPESKFLYLHKLFIVKGFHGIALLHQGSYAIVNMKPMTSAMKKDANLKEGITIAELVKKQYLNGRLGDITIKFEDLKGAHGKYDPVENSITIDKSVLSLSQEYQNYVFLHEFQHAIQCEQGMLPGFGELTQYADKSTLANMVADLKKHRPELFEKSKDADEDVEILSTYVYDTSGEFMANGLYGNLKYVDFYPTVIVGTPTGIVITFPWGTSYNLGIEAKNDTALLTYTENQSYEARLLYKTKKVTNKEFETYVNNKKDFRCFIMPNGDFALITDVNETHSGIIESIYDISDKDYKTFFNSIPQVSIQHRDRGIYAAVRVSGPLTKSSNESLLQVMDMLYSKHIDFTLGDVEYEFYNADEDYDTIVFSNDADNSDDLLTLYNRTKSANKVNKFFPSLAKPKTTVVQSTEVQEPTKKPTKKKKSAPKKARTKNESAADKEVAKRYVSREAAKGTDIQYFLGKYKKIQMSPEMQEFLRLVTGKRIAPSLRDKISGKEKGTLTVPDIMDYLRTTDVKEFDQFTFDTINKAFFKNDAIKTPEQLDRYIDMISFLYSAYRVINPKYPELAAEDDVNKTLRLVNNLQSLPDTNKDKVKYLKYVTDYNKETPYVDYKYARWAFMSNFDGSLLSSYHLAKTIKTISRKSWDTAGNVKTVSINKSIGEDLVIGDTLQDEEAYSNIVNAVEGLSRSDKQQQALLYAINYIRRRFSLNGNTLLTMKQAINKILTISDKELNKLLVKTMISQITGIDLETLEQMGISKPVEKAVESERPGSSIVNNIRSILNTQNRRLTLAQKKLFVKYNSDLFEISNQKVRFKTGVLEKYKSYNKGRNKYTDIKGLTELWNKMLLFSEQVKAGEYYNEKMYKAAEKNRKLMRELLENQRKQGSGNTKTKTVVKEKIVEVHVSDSVLEIKSDRPMPAALERILDFEFSKPVKTRVKQFSDGDDTHRKASYKEFLDNNAERLEALTQDEVNDIVDFYLNTQISEFNISEEKYRLYQVTEGWILAFLLRGNKLGWYSLSENQYDSIRKHLTLRASVAGQMLQAHSTAIQIADPEKIIIKSLARSTGVEFEEADIEELTTAIHSGNIERITSVKKRMYNNAMKKYSGRKKKFTEKLIQFERIMMLSGPGTWVRNWTSNAIIGGIYVGDKQVVPGLLDTSEHVGNLATRALRKMFPNKKWFNSRAGQYKIIGTKVTDDVKGFLDKHLISNGFLAEILDGISKYNPRNPKKTELTPTAVGAQALARTIASGIATKIFYANTTDVKVLDNIYNFVIKRISDDKYVQRRMLSYLGKMLTEDKTDLRGGLTNEVTNTIAEAFILASQDFMHKSNIFTKFEAEIFRRAPRPVYFAYKQFFPFASASWNWFIEGLNYTPMGLIKSIINFAKLENTIDKLERDRANKYLTGDTVISSRLSEYTAIRNVGKGVIGTIGTLIGCLLALFGVVRLDEEDDKYKLKCGNLYVDVSDIFTTQGIFLGMSITRSIMDANDNDANFVDLFTSALDVMFADSIFTDLYNTFRYNDGVGDLFLCLPEKVIGAFIPNFFKTIASMSNKYKVKYNPGILGKIEKLAANSVPFLAYAFPKYIDPYTGEKQVMYKAPFITNMINKLSPLDIAVYNVSDVEKAAIELGVNKSMLTGNYTVNDEKVRLTAKQTEEVNKYYGQLNKVDLDLLFTDKIKCNVEDANGKYKELKFSQMNEKQKGAAIEQIMSKNGTYAKVYMLTSNGYDYYATGDTYKRLRELGIDNVYKKTKTKEGFVKR